MQNEKQNLKKRAYIYALNVIKFFNSYRKKDRSIDIITKQVIRSATSVGANIIEAQASSSKKDFTNYFNHALKSANESLFWLNLLRDSQNIHEESLERLIQETGELANILGASLLTLRGKR